MAAQFAGDLPHAVRYMAESILIDPNDHELPAQMAMYWTSMGDLKQAEPWLQKAEELGPNETVTVAARIMVLHNREQRGMAADLARRALESGLENRAGTKGLIEAVFVASKVARGETVEALNYYRKDFPEAFEQPLPPSVTEDSFFPGDLVTIAGLLLFLDPDSEHAQTLLSTAEAQLARTDRDLLPWVHDVNLARIAAIRGNDELALEYLQAAINGGLRNNWQWTLQIDMVFQRLHDKPRFRELVAQVEANMARQREQAIALLEIGP